METGPRSKTCAVRRPARTPTRNPSPRTTTPIQNSRLVKMFSQLLRLTELSFVKMST